MIEKRPETFLAVLWSTLVNVDIPIFATYRSVPMAGGIIMNVPISLLLALTRRKATYSMTRLGWSHLYPLVMAYASCDVLQLSYCRPSTVYYACSAVGFSESCVSRSCILDELMPSDRLWKLTCQYCHIFMNMTEFGEYLPHQLLHQNPRLTKL